MFPDFVVPGVLAVILLILICSNAKVVKQSHACIIERLGKYSRTWQSGLHVKFPFIDKIVKNVSLKEQVADFPPQNCICKDNATCSIDSVVYFQIMDPRLFTYGIEQPIIAIENLTATTLRNIIGELELDECLTSRDIINTKMRSILDEATDPWGIKVTRVEIKNILPPEAIREAMEKQLKAERDKRAAILKAEGDKQSAILEAEGEKEAAVLRAEAQRIQIVKEAEGNAESIRLEQDARAAGYLALRKAEAEGVSQLKTAGLSSDEIVKLRSLDAFSSAADGKATKIIIPSEIQGIAGLAAGVMESAKNG